MSHLRLAVAAFAVIFLSFPVLHAQCVSLTTLGAASGQNFNSLPSAPANNVAWTDNSTLAGWYSTRTTYNIGTGSSNTGALWDFGIAGTNPVTERALGGVASGGTGTFYWATCYTNNTGAPLTSVNISYVGEQWRDGGAATPVAQTMVVEYQVAAAGTITDADTPTSGWTAAPALNFTSPTFTNTGAGVPLDGNAAANRTAIAATITTGVPIGSQFWIRWQDINNAGNDHGLAVDDFFITPQGAPPLPTLNINNVTQAETNAGTTTFSFTVSLTAPAGPGGVTFDIATADNTATTADSDYVAKSLTGQTIPAGNNTYTFDVLVNGDTNIEGPESFFVNVTNIVGATPGDTQGDGNIQNDDSPTLNINDVNLVEGPGGTTTFAFTVSLTQPAGPGGVTFDIATADNTATAVSGDYIGNSLTGQTITAGNSTYTFNVTVNGDNNVEPTESFFVNVTNITGATAGDVQGVGTIATDEPLITVGNVTQVETNGATTTFAFTVSLDIPAPPGGVTFDIATAPGTATAGSDYVHQALTAQTITAGNTSYTFNVTVNGDTVFEPNETFFANVSNVSLGAGVSDGSGTGTITNDDAQPAFSIADVALTEGNAGTQVMTFTISLSGSREGSMDINVATADNSATVGDADYVANATIITFAPTDTTRTFDVTINGDTNAEGNEQFFVNLSSATGGATISDAQALGIIRLDDAFSIAAVDTPYVENFDVLAQTTAATTPVGWTQAESGTNANFTYSAGTGSSTTGDTYSFGVAGVNPITDRAFGGLQSASLIPTIGAFYRNNTGTTITSLSIQYVGEEWRLGAASRADRLDFQYSLDATSLTTGTWLDSNLLDFTTPNQTGTGAKDGNAAANRTARANTIGGLSIAPGATFWIRFSDFNASGSDDGLAVDDFSIIANFTGAFLSVNDVSLFEGNAGTTTFTFTVSLTQPAPGPGGVNFQVSTADGTAIAPGDYATFNGAFNIPTGGTSMTFNVTVNGDPTIEPTETFFVNIFNVTNAVAADTQGAGTIIDDDTPITKIHTIQGSGASSPIVGSNVTVRAIVTGVKSNGFFLQEEDADAALEGNPATSEGIFVFTSSAPPAGAVLGAEVLVSGTVVEFVPSGDPQQPPLTELSSPVVTQISTGNPLPAPILLTPTFPNPAGAHDQLERVEGMRVQVNSLTVTGPTDGSFNEITGSVSHTGRFYGVVTGVPRPFREPGIRPPDVPPSGSIPPIPRWDGNPERLKVDSNALGAGLLVVKSNDVVAPLVGPLDYGFRSYAILPDGTAPATVTPGVLDPTTTAPLATEITVSSFNVNRLFNDVVDGPPAAVNTAVYQNRLGKASLAIRNNLHMPDIIGVQEVETLSVLQDLAARISADAIAAAQPDPMYVAYLSEGNDPGGIDVGYLVKTAPVAPGLPRVTNIVVTQEGKTFQWTDPDDNQLAFLNDRPPLVLEATINRAPGVSTDITVINNHLRSLLGIESENPAGLTTEGDRVRRKRQAQAEYLANLVQARQTADPAEKIIVIGDFNAFEFNDGLADVVNTITGTPPPDNQTVVPGDGIDLVNPDLDNLVDTPPPSERYSYVHEGNAQNIDHALVNQALINATTARRIEHPRIDADYPDTERNNPATPIRISDHDPFVAYLNIVSLAASEFAVTLTHPTGYATAGANTSYTINVANNGPDTGAATMSIALPAGTSYQSITPPVGWSCPTTPSVGGNGTVTCTTAAMAALTNVNFTLTVGIDGALAVNTVLTRTATIDGANTDAVTTNDSESENVTVLQPSQYRSTKTVSGSFLRGSAVTYTITIFNDKPFTQANNAGDELTDVLPAGVTLVSATATSGTAVATVGTNTVTWNGSIASGSNVTITINATVDADASGVQSNQATLADDFDNNGTNERATVSDDPSVAGATDPTNFTVASSAGLVTATKDVVGSFFAGTNVTYTIVLTNNMALTMLDSAGNELTDVLPPSLTLVSVNATSGTPGQSGNTASWNGSLAPGASVTITIVATIAPAATGPISNQASFAYDSDANGTNDLNGVSDDPDTAAANDATTFNAIAPGTYTATKTVSGSFLRGTNVTYTIVIANNKPFTQGDNPGNELTDVLPAGVTLVSANASSGTAVATIATNTVTWNGSIASGTSVTITITATVDNDATGVQSNQASLSDDSDNNAANDRASVSDDPSIGGTSDPTNFTVASSAGLVAATKDITGGTLVAGTNVTYTIVLTNNMAITMLDSTGNELTDVLPASLTLVSVNATAGTAGQSGNTATWNGSLAPGASVTITIVATISSSATGTISNQATLAYDGDANGSNELNGVSDNPDTAAANDPTNFTVVPANTFSATKRVSGGSFIPGGSVTYQIVLTNGFAFTLDDNAGNEFIDVLPPQLQLVSASATSGTATATTGTNTVTWNGALAAGASVTITIEAAIPANATAGTVTNQGTANVDFDDNGTNETAVPTDDPDTSGAQATAFVIATPAQVTATKSVSTTGGGGQPVTYTIVITNNTGSTLPNNAGHELVDVLPAQVQLDNATATSGTATFDVPSNTVRWNGSLAAGASVTITINARIAAAATGPVSNEATFNADLDGDGDNETAIQTNAAVFQATAVAAIPALSPLMLLALAAMLAAAAVWKSMS